MRHVCYRKPSENIENSPSNVETSSKNRVRFRLDINLETDHPSKTRRANRRVSLKQICSIIRLRTEFILRQIIRLR